MPTEEIARDIRSFFGEEHKALVAYIDNKIKEARTEERNKILEVVSGYTGLESLVNDIRSLPEEE